MVSRGQYSSVLASFNTRTQIFILILIPLSLFYPLIFADLSLLDDKGLIASLINSYETYDLKALFHLFVRKNPTTYYRPLVWTTFLADCWMHLCEPSFMHLENILFHTINGLLVFFLARKLIGALGETKNSWIPFISAVIFVIHPVNTEAVNWISARTDLMAGFFVFLCFFFLLKALEGKKKFIFMAGMSYFLGLLCKEVAIGSLLAIAALMGIFWEKKRISDRQACFVIIVFLVFTVTYASMRGVTIKTKVHQAPQQFIETHTAENQRPALVSEIFHNVLIFGKATGFYFKKLFWPWPLNFAIVKINGPLCLLLGALALVLMVLLVYKKKYIPTFGSLWAMAFMMPAMVVIYTRAAWTPLAERYVYVSSFGGALVLTWMVSQLVGKRLWTKYAGSAFLAIVILVFGFTTHKRNLIWQSNLSLYEDTVAKSPGFAAVHNQYALALWAAGKRHKARAEFKKAAELAGIDDYQYVGKANALAVTSTDTRDLAEKYYAMASKVEKPKIKIWLLGKAIHLVSAQVLKTHDINNKKALYEKQIRYFKTMAELKDRTFYTYRIGQRYLAMGMKEEAAHYFEQTRRMSPNSIYGKAAKKLLDKLTSNPIS